MLNKNKNKARMKVPVGVIRGCNMLTKAVLKNPESLINTPRSNKKASAPIVAPSIFSIKRGVVFWCLETK